MLSKGEVDSKKIRVEFSLEDMDMSEFQDGATGVVHFKSSRKFPKNLLN